MSVRSLWTKILLAAIVNVALVLALLAFAGVLPWPHTLEDVAVWSAGDDVMDLARRVALDLAITDPGTYPRLLDEYGAEAHATLVLARNDGSVVAGAVRELPFEVRERLRQRPGRPADGPEAIFGDGRRGPFSDGRGGPAEGRFGGPGARGGGGRGRRGGSPMPPPFFVRTDSSPAYWMGARIGIPEAGRDVPTPGVLLVASDTLIGSGFFRPTLRSAGLIAAAIAITALCWIPLLRGMTRAIDQLETATAHIAQGRFDHRADASRNDELGSLAKSVNTMASRLDRSAADQIRFLGDTAHELRSPLGRVQVALEILQGKASDVEQPYLADLREDVNELTDLTNDLLEFARTRVSTPTTAPEPVDLDVLIAEVIRVERATADIRVHVPADLQVIAHRKELARALANIVRNAVRYAAEAGPIDVAAKADAGRVDISVSDTGPGVPPEAVDRLFTPFFRVDASRNRKSGGAGLGLAIAKTAIDACGGTISCRNRPNGGLEITISLADAAAARIS